MRTFGALITACGTTHLMEIWTLWYPTYWLSGITKAITALISMYTAATLLPLVPQALALPSPAQLEAANRELKREVTERKQIEIEWQQAYDELEHRAIDLLKANENLSHEMAERELVQETLRQSEVQHRAILEAIPDLLLRVKKDGTYLDCRFPKDLNAGFFLSINEHISEILSPESLQRQLDTIEIALITGELQVYEHQLTKQGQLAYEELRITAIGEDEVLLMVRDITERKQLEEDLYQAKQELEQRVQERTEQLMESNQALQQSEARYRAIVEDQTELITRFKADGTLTFVNDAYCRYFGLNKDEIIGSRYEPLILEEDQEKVARLIDSISLDNPVVTTENRVIIAGQIYWTQWINRIILDEQGRFVEFQSVGRDITDLQKAYEQLELRVQERTQDLAQVNQELQIEVTERKRAEEQIKASLREKEVLLQEIHHRVKNNLQVICSLLNLQSRKIKDPDAFEILKESQNRIRSMAVIHERLYQSEDLSRINFAEYIRYLVNNLFRSYGVDTNRITFKTEISNRILLDVDTAVNCGLIVNELISNSLKYAFPKAQQGLISVKIQLTHEQGLIMLISDNGIGLPPDFDLENTKTLGLKLVNSWMAQLNGNIEINTRFKGTEFKITLAELDLEKNAKC